MMDMSPLRSIVLLVYLILFSLGTFGLASCSQLMFWKTASIEEIRKAEEYLIESIDALVGIDPAVDPDRYYDKRTTFERALAAYLTATGKHDRSVIQVAHKGTNIIIPVRRIGYDDHISDIILTDTVSTIWQNIGPVFRGEIIDVAVVQKGNNYFVAALFSDSLTLFLTNGPETNVTVVHFPSEHMQNIRSQRPAGMLEPDDRNHLYFITTHLDNAFQISGLDSNAYPIAYEYPLTMTPVAGTPFFSYNQDGIINIFSVRNQIDKERTIVLDDRGYLYLTSIEDHKLIWRSERSWGDRLFRVGNDKIAVTHPYDNRFMLFEVQSDRLEFTGVSSRFYGRVGAVAAMPLPDKMGYLVSITTGDKKADTYTQLHFVSENFIRWQDPGILSQPVFPDYDVGFVFADNVGNIFDQGYIEHNLSQIVWNNLYETLLRYNSDGVLEYNLAASIVPDDDNRQWTVSLKPDVRFSDGTHISAEIVFASWMRNLKVCRDNACVYTWLSEDIRDIHIVDDHTLLIRLDRSLPNFSEHLTAPCFQVAKESERSQWLVGTGPYVITDSDRLQSPRSVSGSRNPFYHRGLPFFKDIIFIDRRANVIDYMVDREDTGILVRNPRVIDFFTEIDDYRISPTVHKATYFLVLNPGSSRLRSVQSRAKIIDAFEREALVTVVTEARSELAKTFFHTVEIDRQSAPANFTMPGGNPLRIYYLRQDPVAEQIAQRLEIRLQQLGIATHSPTGFSMERLKEIRRHGYYDILIDSFIPRFASDAYNMYDLLQRGFLYDEELKEKAEKLLLSENHDTLVAIEQYFTEKLYLHSLVRTPLHAIIPRNLNHIDSVNMPAFDFYGAWFPKE